MLSAGEVSGGLSLKRLMMLTFRVVPLRRLCQLAFRSAVVKEPMRPGGFRLVSE